MLSKLSKLEAMKSKSSRLKTVAVRQTIGSKIKKM